MAENGKLEKMLILAFDDSQKAEDGGPKADSFEALINPESYTLDYKLKFSELLQAPGTIGRQLRYEYTAPEELTFEFLFDNTGIIDGISRDSITKELDEFKRVLIEYKGSIHEPRHFKLVWGQMIFKGRVTEVSITYKMFRPDGTPIRAVAKVKFKSSIEDLKQAAKKDNKSSDLTHVRRIKAGDTLPLMCHWVYGDPKYYLQVAQVNGLGNFRSLEPGKELLFPPIAKTNNSL